MAMDNSTFISYLIYEVTHDEEFLEIYADKIEPESFENAETTWLLETAVTFWKTYGTVIDAPDIAMRLDEKPDVNRFDKDTVRELYDEAPELAESSRVAYFDFAAEWLKSRALKMAVSESVEALEEGHIDAARDILREHLNTDFGIEEAFAPVDAFVDVEARVQSIVDIFSEQEGSIQTGLPTVDYIMRGGLMPGELGVVLAPPQRGKSQLLTFIGRSAWLAGKGVVYISMEMGVDDLLMRLYAGLIDVSANQIPLQGDSVKKRLLKKVGKKEVPAYIVQRYPSKGITVSGIKSFVTRVMKDRQIDLIIVDYGDIVAPSKSYNSRVDEQAIVYEELRAMSIELAVPVWTASQSNRLSLDRHVITIAHLADSFDKAKVADYILAICQGPDEKKLNPPRVRLMFAKCRYNESGDPINCEIEYDKSIFREIDIGDEDFLHD